MHSCQGSFDSWALLAALSYLNCAVAIVYWNLRCSSVKIDRKSLYLFLLQHVILFGLSTCLPLDMQSTLHASLVSSSNEWPSKDMAFIRCIWHRLCLIRPFSSFLCCPSPLADDAATFAEQRHIVIFDAGSTGTRVHVFTFQFLTNNATLWSVDSGLSLKIGIPLSRFLMSHRELDSLVIGPLVQFANTLVPQAARSATPIAMYATAGLRNASFSLVQPLMNKIASILTATGYLLKDASKHVRVIQGQEEGLFGWLSVNLLKERLFRRDAALYWSQRPLHAPSSSAHLKGLSLLEKSIRHSCQTPSELAFEHSSSDTLLSIDLGGSSTQLAFEITEEEAQTLEQASPLTQSVARLAFFSRNLTLFCVSYHGFGLETMRKSARQRFFNGLTNIQALKQVSMPCFAAFYSETVTLDNGHLLTLCGSPAVSYTACRQYIEPLLGLPSQTFSDRIGLPCSFQHTLLPRSMMYHKTIVAFSAFGDVLHHFFDPLVEITLHDLLYLTNLTCLAGATQEHMDPVPSDWFAHYPSSSCMSKLSYHHLYRAVRRDHLLCHDMTYLTLLLQRAYRFTSATKIVVAQKMNNITVTWALGAAALLL